MKQIYFCERCKKVGAVYYEKGDDVWSVMQSIRNDHRNESPACTAPTADIKVMNGAVKDLPAWAQDEAKHLLFASGEDRI